MRSPPLRAWAMRLLGVSVLLGLVNASASADAGDTLDALRDYCLGPALYLVAACGAVYALWQWARGRKEAVFYALGGLLFLAFVRQALLQWLAPGVAGGSHPEGLSLGEFPVYGQTPSVQVPGEVNSYQDIRAWGYLGLVYCNLITSFCFGHGVPVLIAGIGALVTYWRITVQHQAGSVVAYLLTVILVTAFAVVPWVSFAPRDPASVLANDAVRAIDTFNAQQLGGSLTTSSALMVPLLPGLVLVAGVDLSEGIGELLNAHPVQGYASQLLRAARNSQLPEDWLPQYQDFAACCAAAQKGFVFSEANPRAYNPTVDYSRAMFQALQRHQVGGAAANALSSWGDNLFAFIPLHGYVFNDAEDWDVLHQVHELSRQDQETITASMQHMTSLPTGLSGDEKSVLMADWSRIAVGDPGGHQFATAPAVVDTQAGDFVWTLPFNAMLARGGVHPWEGGSFAPGDGMIAVPYCSLPLDGGGNALGPFTVSVSTPVENPGVELSGFDSLVVSDPDDSTASFTISDDSQYLRDIVAASVTDTAGGSVTIHPLDWSEQLRADLVRAYRSPMCLSACGSVEHKNFWGCLVSGQFIGLAQANPQCQSAAALTQVFYGGAVDGRSYQASSGQTYAGMIEGNLYHRYAAKPRGDADLAQLAQDVLAGATARDGSAPGDPSASPGEIRIMADLIMSAPGNYSQNPLATDPYNLPKEQSARSPSFWHLLEDLPKAALWLLQTFVALAETIISWMWPPFMGVVLVVFLLVYPLFSMIALWPGRWHILSDWCRGMCWVLLWAPLVSLGYSFKNAGALLTQDSGFGSALPMPGHTVLALIGCCIIVMAPPIANAVLSPSYASLARMGASIYGTGFKVLAMSGQVAVAMASIGVASAGAAAGGAWGVASASRASASAGASARSGSPGPDPATARAAERTLASGGRLAGALARARRFASQGAQLAQPLWSGASQALTTGMEAVDRAGLHEHVHGAGGGFSGAGRTISDPMDRAWQGSRQGQRLSQLRSPTAVAGMAGVAEGASPPAMPTPPATAAPPRTAAESAVQAAGMRSTAQHGVTAAGGGPVGGEGDARTRLLAARQRGDPDGVRRAAQELARDGLIGVEAARASRDASALLDALHAQIEAEELLAGLDAPGAASSSAAAHQQRAAGGRREALALAQRLAGSSDGIRGAQMGIIGRTEASLWAGEAEAAFQRATLEPGDLAQARVAGERAMGGYAQASQLLGEELMDAAAAAGEADPAALRRVVVCGAGLSLVSLQAQALARASGGALTLPAELAPERVARDLAIASGASGGVGRSLLQAVLASHQGDDAHAARALAQASAQAQQQAGHTRGQREALAAFAQQLATSAQAFATRSDQEPISRQGAFLHGVAGEAPVGSPLGGLRRF